MASHSVKTDSGERLTLPSWLPKLPLILIVAGALVAGITAAINLKQFAYSYLVAYMFFLSICLGGLFLVLIHHLFDAMWSVPIRRICEHLAYMLWVMGILFIPIALLAPQIYQWMRNDPGHDHALAAKLPLFTKGGFYLIAVALFLIWW